MDGDNDLTADIVIRRHLSDITYYILTENETKEAQ